MTTQQQDVPAGAPDQAHHRVPTFGFTKHGHAVHGRTTDHLPEHNAYARFNKKVALLITDKVGTMTCFWLFCIISLVALPAVLKQVGLLPSLGLITNAGFVLVVQWVAQSFIQLVLLPALMVGQNLQNVAADARSAKTFEDVEHILDLLDTHTQGGLAAVLEAIDNLRAAVVASAGGQAGTGG